MSGIKEKKNSISCSCPLAPWTHSKKSDSRPSFSIRITDSGQAIYNCFACHSRGSIKTLISKLFHKTKDKQILDLLGYVEKNLKFDINAVIHNKKPEPLYLDESIHGELCPKVEDYKPAIEYCLSRGISLNTCDRLDLRYHPEDKRIIFKIYDYLGKFLGVSGRSINSSSNLKVLTTANPSIKNTFIGLHKLDRDAPILLVEGLFMYAKMHEYNLDKKFNILAAMGSTLTKNQRDILLAISNKLYLFFDNDEAGLSGIFGGKGLKGVNRELGEYLQIYNLDYPEGIIDPDELSKEQVIHMLDNAECISR